MNADEWEHIVRPLTGKYSPSRRDRVMAIFLIHDYQNRRACEIARLETMWNNDEPKKETQSE